MNSTNYIQNLFNSDPMLPENIYEPSGVCIGDTVLDNTPSGFALFQAIGGHYTSPAQAIEELVDNAISSIRANGGSGKVILCLTDGGDYVDISGCGGAQTPLNEHGCGLKNALSYLSEEAELWLLESRTKEDAAADRYPVIDVKATGENILRRRIEKGYTVLDVQRYLNLACPQSVYHWQAGRTLPNIDNFYALSVLFGTTVNDLVVEQESR